ncbi:hypothetical protein [Profundibacter amoris]|uniref:Uncharacterized protein n=1 Tax=Profundibacter amoris TaxID=2171755 RepID=A0A347UF98_9RHOB|nr:hypothetical protein [Profundibacter amoris]AXX97526.1 hypothetical protein BAR1_05995 [Profundibacter amoris]
MKIINLFSAVLAGTIFSSSIALAQVYVCDITSIKRGGGIASVIVFSVNRDETEITVYDGYIKKYYDRPIEAEISVANPKRYTFKWEVKMSGNTNVFGQDLPGIRYRATYLRAKHTIRVRGFPIGYDNQYSGSGICRIEK